MLISIRVGEKKTTSIYFLNYNLGHKNTVSSSVVEGTGE